jgi:hypothetical protein
MTVMTVAAGLPLSAQRATKRIYVSALDAQGAPVLDLQAADFRVTEDGFRRDVTRAARGTAPLRIVLLVDSSTAMNPMMAAFRDGLNAFESALPPEHEVAFITTGGQLRVRTQPKDDRQKLKNEFAHFVSEGAANAFVDSLVEADRRFLKTAPAQWPVIVIVTTDNGETRREPQLQEYNKFMNDFLARGGAAHAIVILGQQPGPVSDVVQNLVTNTQGERAVINSDFSLPARMKHLAERVANDHRLMADRYEVEFTGDARLVQPIVNIEVVRDAVRASMSPRRPF